MHNVPIIVRRLKQDGEHQVILQPLIEIQERERNKFENSYHIPQHNTLESRGRKMRVRRVHLSATKNPLPQDFFSRGRNESVSPFKFYSQKGNLKKKQKPRTAQNKSNHEETNAETPKFLFKEKKVRKLENLGTQNHLNLEEQERKNQQLNRIIFENTFSAVTFIPQNINQNKKLLNQKENHERKMFQQPKQGIENKILMIKNKSKYFKRRNFFL